MTLLISILLIAVASALLRVTYRWGFANGQHKGIEDSRVAAIKSTHRAWREGMLSERKRVGLFNPSETSKE